MIQTAISLSKRLCPPRAAHAERVVKLLGKATKIEKSAAYLHDIIEDMALEEDDLRRFMGDKVTNIVLELTNTSLAKGRNFEHLRHASLEAKRIKLADRIDNIKKRMTSTDVMYYVKETENLLDILKGADKRLEGMLRVLVTELRARCAKYTHENLS